ncbi:SusC/RagA family TonB-linked outer membrane protein [Flavitalea sp.]|nr:SusC/RagA family TonB-linked outer membrane protein [Flavitalea sp.]
MKCKIIQRLFLLNKIIQFPIILLSLVLLTNIRVYSQSAPDPRSVFVNLHEENQYLNEIFDRIEMLSSFKFVYNSTDIRKLGRFTISKKNYSVYAVLNDLLPASLLFEQQGTNILITRKTLQVIPVFIKGKVVDERGTALPGVSVSVANSLRGVTTDTSGKFVINGIKAEDSLEFTFIGYIQTRIRVGNTTDHLIRLLRDSTSALSNIVVLGYGNTMRSNISTAIGLVSTAQISERPNSINIVQAIAGKIPGVSVMLNSGKPGGKPTIKIRGTGSINASNIPLYVIDGFVGADPAIVDPSIIASVSVLKDAAAAAIYGSRGSNGVIILTTKEGQKERSEISYSGTLSVGKLARELELLDADGALEMFRRTYEYVPGRMAPHLDPFNFFARKTELFYSDGKPIHNINWQEAATREALSHNHSLTFSGGKDDLTVLANISYRNQQGIMLNSYSRQVNGYINVGWNVKKWLGIKASINTGGTQSNNIDLNTLGLNPLRQMVEFLPFLPVTYEDGTYSRKSDYPGAENSENPVRLLNDVKSITGRTYTQANIIATFHLAPDLDFISSLSGFTSAGYNFYYAGRDVYDYSATQQGIARRTHTNGGSWTNEDYFSYTKKSGKHRFNAIAGASWYYYLSTSTAAGAQNFFDDYFSFNNLQAGSVWEQPTSGTDRNQLNSFYTRVNYNFDNRYLFGASLRADGSSRFGANSKYGIFPSVSAGWVISEEDFFPPTGAINTLKLRASIGTNGNAAIGNYVTLNRLNASQVVFDNRLYPAVTVAELGNQDLKWEKARQLNFGLDLILFNGRIDLVADVYDKVTSDLLYRKQLPVTTGYSGVFDNIGSIRNRGLELGINARVISGKGFSWNTGINYSMNRSIVLRLNGDIINTWGGRIAEGRPLNEFFGYLRQDAWGLDEAAEAAVYAKKPGDLKWADINGNKMTDADDRVPLGNGMPDFEANFENHFRYKKISLFVDVQVMYGHKIINFFRNIDETQAPWANSYKSILNAWTPQNQNTPLAQLRLPLDGNENRIDSYNIEDGSFLRIRNISLSYDLTRLLNKFGMKRGSLTVLAENYFLLTGYKGYDPENTSFDGDLNQGVDFFQYPKAKTISINLSVTI